jgi:hypothetical protein
LKSKKIAFLLLILGILTTSCNSDDGVDGPGKQLPQYSIGLLTGFHPETGYPYMSENKAVVSDSLYHVGFYFEILTDEFHSDNRIVSYYGKITLLSDDGHWWRTIKVICEKEIDSLYDHHFQFVCNGYYNDSFASNDTLTYYLHYHFEIECLSKYCRKEPPIVPMKYHQLETLLSLK